MTYEVIITPSAKADIFELRVWLLENRPEVAEGWLWDLSQCLASLRSFPLRGPVSEESAAFDVEVRALLFGSKRNIYRLLYSVREREVYILRVRSTRQRRLSEQFDED